MGNWNGKSLTSVGVVGAAVNKGQPKDGTQNGPAALRAGGLDAVLKSMGKLSSMHVQCSSIHSYSFNAHFI